MHHVSEFSGMNMEKTEASQHICVRNFIRDVAAVARGPTFGRTDSRFHVGPNVASGNRGTSAGAPDRSSSY